MLEPHPARHDYYNAATNFVMSVKEGCLALLLFLNPGKSNPVFSTKQCIECSNP